MQLLLLSPTIPLPLPSIIISDPYHEACSQDVFTSPTYDNPDGEPQNDCSPFINVGTEGLWSTAFWDSDIEPKLCNPQFLRNDPLLAMNPSGDDAFLEGTCAKHCIEEEDCLYYQFKEDATTKCLLCFK